MSLRILINNKRGQTTADYVVLVTAVAAAFMLMNSLVNYAIQGRLGQIQDYVAEREENASNITN